MNNIENDYFGKISALCNLSHVVLLPTAIEWQLVEDEINLKLPEDYKLLISKIGNGTFGNSLRLMNAVQSTNYSISRYSISYWYETLEYFSEEFSVPIYPDSNGLFIISWTGSDFFLAYETLENKCINNNILIIDTSYGIEKFEMGICQFLFKLYMKKLNTKFAENLRKVAFREGSDFFTPFDFEQ